MSTPETPRPEITRVLHALTDRLHESLCNCKAYPDSCVSKAQYRRDELAYTLTYAEDALDVALAQGWTPPAPVVPATEDPAPTQQWAVRHPDVGLSVHRSPHSVLYTASKLPGGTIVTRMSDQAEWRVETNCLCGDRKPADRHYEACPGDTPAPQPRVWGVDSEQPTEPGLRLRASNGVTFVRTSWGRWLAVPPEGDGDDYSWSHLTGTYGLELTEVLSEVPAGHHQ